MSYYNTIASTDEFTVVTEYTPEPRTATEYQSEADLEREFIRMLRQQGYEYLPIHKEVDLINNLRVRLSELNNYNFTDTEWNYFFKNVIASKNDGILEKTKIIQEDYQQLLKRDDGSNKNIKLIDKNNVYNNKLQVINQYEVSQNEGAKHKNRYDVTILINGLPIVHIELKRRGVEIEEAFNQIERYQRESFWAGSGLFEYAQIFVISNGTNTKYYSNSTRWNITHDKNGIKTRKGKTSNSFQFTSFWTDANNKRIADLVDFTKTFFVKHTLLNILTKYCVFTTEKKLLVMRPYQIVAAERIINKIQTAINYNQSGSIKGGGYIWHTTGSGKTLTSFKTAQLASKLTDIDKVLFVVDRKDLDYQTMREYNRFQEGAANSTKDTATLTKQLGDPDTKIIITTIQKLYNFICKNKNHNVYNRHVVIIFDECHRSQFGDMHKKITKVFKKYHIFGFTGTPIFVQNAVPVFSTDTKRKINSGFLTTAQVFGEQLHKYTIIDAINDHNVLPFKVEFWETMKKKKDIKDEQVLDIDREKAYMAPKRIQNVTEYILKHFNQKTYRNEKFTTKLLKNVKAVTNAKPEDVKRIEEFEDKVLNGFNSIFAVSSVGMAKLYYNEFKQQQKNKTNPLKIAIIYSYAPNGVEIENDNVQLGEENSEDTCGLSKLDRDFLDKAIEDYNSMFQTNYSTDDDKFQNYYKDVSLRVKNKEIDLLIVVNMFLTGFDAPTLNTLWVDKNLKMHGLIQAFSRTNRILGKVKAFGNIVCFRDLRNQVREAIALFGNKDAGGIILLKRYEDYYFGYIDDKGGQHPGFEEIVKRLTIEFPLSEQKIIGEQKEKDFIKLFGQFLRVRSILSSFDEFEGNEILSDRDIQDYSGRYLDLRTEWVKRQEKGKLANINDDIVFEIELIKQIEINVDYILMLVAEYQKNLSMNKEDNLAFISKAVNSSPTLRSKKDLIEEFINSIDGNTDDIANKWSDYISKKREVELEMLIKEEKLKDAETRAFIKDAFRNGKITTIGSDIDKILPAVSYFADDGNNRGTKMYAVIEKLEKFFERFWIV